MRPHSIGPVYKTAGRRFVYISAHLPRRIENEMAAHDGFGPPATPWKKRPRGRAAGVSRARDGHGTCAPGVEETRAEAGAGRRRGGEAAGAALRGAGGGRSSSTQRERLPGRSWEVRAAAGAALREEK